MWDFSECVIVIVIVIVIVRVRGADALRLKATRQLSFLWIKGHATKNHIDREIPTTLDKRGNEAADVLASAAAAHHAASQALIEAARKRRRVALTTHIFVADLLQRRDVLRSMSEVDPG